MDKLKLSGLNMGRVFSYWCGRICTSLEHPRPKQVLGYLQLAFELPGDRITPRLCWSLGWVAQLPNQSQEANGTVILLPLVFPASTNCTKLLLFAKTRLKPTPETNLQYFTGKSAETRQFYIIATSSESAYDRRIFPAPSVRRTPFRAWNLKTNIDGP
jgi:hypothetical protein